MPTNSLPFFFKTTCSPTTSTMSARSFTASIVRGWSRGDAIQYILEGLLKIDLNENTLINKSQEKNFNLKSLGEVIDIIEAGNIFEYARKSGMIPSSY